MTREEYMANVRVFRGTTRTRGMPALLLFVLLSSGAVFQAKSATDVLFALVLLAISAISAARLFATSKLTVTPAEVVVKTFGRTRHFSRGQIKGVGTQVWILGNRRICPTLELTDGKTYRLTEFSFLEGRSGTEKAHHLAKEMGSALS